MDWMEEQRKKEYIKEKMREDKTFSKDYISWLEEFTKTHWTFTKETFNYSQENLTENDINNINLTEALFELTDDFADDNYIKPIRHDYGAYYPFKHNEVGYYVGFDCGQGTTFYIARLPEPENNSIEYDDLIKGEKLPNTILIDEKLEELRSLIERLGKEEVPTEAIHQVTDAEIQKIKTKKQKY